MQALRNPLEIVSPRERILAAARKIFLDGLPEHATMDAVAQQAGMSKKTIYREFKSQVELLGALLLENVADMGPSPAATQRRHRARALRHARAHGDPLHQPALHGARAAADV